MDNLRILDMKGMKKPIFLLGMMGCGKSSLSKKLAKALDRKFIDLDTVIMDRDQLSVTAIFESFGEAYFRKRESEVLRSLSYEEDPIIALGGGTPCFLDNMQYIKKQGVSIYLEEDVELLTSRIYGDNRRPLVDGKSEDEVQFLLTNMLEQRAPFYTRADYIFPSGSLDDHVSCFLRILELKMNR